MEAWHHIDMPLCAVVVGKVLPLASKNIVFRVKLVTPIGGVHVADCVALRSLSSCACVVSRLRACWGVRAHGRMLFGVVFFGWVPVGRSGPVCLPLFLLSGLFPLFLPFSLSSSVFSSFSLCLSFLPQLNTVNEESIHQIGLNTLLGSIL